MAINLTKYRNELLDAWKDVVDDKTPNNWALFGYERQTNDLQVIGKGDGGLEELADEFNSGKIMYAFCRVADPNTELPKLVFINWQGEGAPLSRKGACANHVMDVSNFFKGAHVTVNARTEDDVEPALIMEKVAKASASKFNFKDRSDPVENVTPVGSVYRRIQPTREINPVEREKFWMKEQEEEKKRISEERQKAEEERLKLDKERKEREIREATARDEVARERARSINQMREAERNADNIVKTKEAEKLKWAREQQQQDEAKEELERRTRSESLRRERNKETRSLISQRTINARAIFEQNTCAGQMSSMRSTHQPKVLQEFEASQMRQESSIISPPEKFSSPAPQSPEKIESSPNKVTEPEIAKYDAPLSPPEEFHYTRNLLKEGLPTRQDSELDANAEEEQNWDEPTLEAPPDVRDPLAEMMAEHGMVQQPQDNTQIITSSLASEGLRARAIYDYQAADETEISFDPDDIITYIEQIDEGWWQGMAPNGSYGLFPANYVELLD